VLLEPGWKILSTVFNLCQSGSRVSQRELYYCLLAESQPSRHEKCGCFGVNPRYLSYDFSCPMLSEFSCSSSLPEARGHPRGPVLQSCPFPHGVQTWCPFSSALGAAFRLMRQPGAPLRAAFWCRWI